MRSLEVDSECLDHQSGLFSTPYCTTGCTRENSVQPNNDVNGDETGLYYYTVVYIYVL